MGDKFGNCNAIYYNIILIYLISNNIYFFNVLVDVIYYTNLY